MAHACNCKSLPSACPPNPRRLFICSFDETISAHNTVNVIAEMLPSCYLPAPISTEQREERICYQNQLYHVLASYCGVTGSKMRHLMERTPEVPGMVPFLRNLSHIRNCELLLVSLSNSVLINFWLQGHSVAGCFRSIKCYPAHFLPSGALVVEPYHKQTSCNICSSTLCKGRIVEEYLEERKHKLGQGFDQIIFIGNGSEDICPGMRLREEDLVCARRGCPMVKAMERSRKDHSLRASLLMWNDGKDLETKLRQRLFK